MNELHLLELRGKVAYLTLNRPAVLNALNHEARCALAERFESLETDPDVRVIVLRGAGRAFCAGQDQKESSGFDAARADQRIDTYGKLFAAMRQLTKPVIARMHGYAAGAGCQLAMLADLRIADESTKVGLTELNVGSAAITGSALLWNIAGEATVKWLYLTGEFLPAQEAWRLGLLHEVVPAERLDARVDGLAEGLAARPPMAIKVTKEWWRQLTEEMFQRTIERAHTAHAANFAAGSLSQGARGFVARQR
jgi:enoyl-CoA hydratase/carnithine racemase